MRILILSLLAASAFGAVAVSPSGCATTGAGALGGTISVHPCTVTVTFAGTSATANEITEIQNVFDSAHRGDTLITPAKDISSCSLNMEGTNMGGPADQYFVWKSEHYDAKFPTDDTMVTMAYRPIMTRVSCTLTSGEREFRIRGRLSRTQPEVVDGFKIQGIAFIHGYTTNLTNTRSGSLEIGESATEFATITKAAMSSADNINYTPVEADLQSFLYDVTTPVTSTTGGVVTATADTEFLVGDTVYLSGTSNPAHNGVWVVATEPSSSSFTASGLTGDSTGGTVRDKRETVYRNDVAVDPSEYTWTPWYSRVTFLVAQNPGDVITISGTSFDATLPEHQPTRIIIKHCIFDGESDLDKRNISRMLTIHGNDVQVIGSHFEGSGAISGDTQSILGANGYGPHSIINNYVGGGAENYMNGGSTASLGPYYTRGLIYRYNYNVQEEWYNFQARANSTWYRKGMVIKQDSSNDIAYLSENTGVSGSSTPTWNTTTGATTVDGTVTWRRLGTGRHHRVVKNLMEFKQMSDALVEYNYFHRNWSADQACMLVFKTENQHAGYSPFLKSINNTIRYNILDDGYCAVAAVINEVGGDAFGPFYIYGNVWRNMSHERRWTPYSSANDAFRCGLRNMQFGGNSPVTSYFYNNTMDAWSNPSDSTCSATGHYAQGSDGGSSGNNSANFIFRNNILTRTGRTGLRPGFWGADGSETEGSVYIRKRMQGESVGSSATPVPADRWTKNIHSGAPADIYPGTATGDTGNTNYNTARDSIGFRGASVGNFRLKSSSSFFRDGTDGLPLGADWSEIPEMLNFTVQATDREATFTWNMSAAISDNKLAANGLTAACAATVGARDLLSFVSDLDPNTYTLPHVDTNDIHIRRGSYRMIRVGSRVALTPSTEYGYRIQCPGYAKEGTFTTAATLAGTGTLSVRNPAATTMTWGYTYSRTTDTISGGGAGSCSSGTCTATVNKGVAIYYRINSGRVQFTYVQ